MTLDSWPRSESSRASHSRPMRGCGARSKMPPPSATRPPGRCSSTREHRRSSATTTARGWFNMLWVGGYTFETPPPLVTDEGIKPLPATGVRKLHSRTSFLYVATGITPAMCMRLTGLGSQYLMTVKDADGNRLDGGKAYRMTLPPDIPAARFWSLTAYDNETRSMLQTPQRFPRAGSQSYPTPAATANPDGSTTITFRPERPSDTPESNWIQTTEGKGWFPILRLYSPLQPFFNKSWRAGE